MLFPCVRYILTQYLCIGSDLVLGQKNLIVHPYLNTCDICDELLSFHNIGLADLLVELNTHNFVFTFKCMLSEMIDWAFTSHSFEFDRTVFSVSIKVFLLHRM